MPDFGFVGASYVAPSIYQDDQECINWYPEVDPTKEQGARGVIALYPTPGLELRLNIPNGEVRALYTLPFPPPQSNLLYAVVGNGLYIVNTAFAFVLTGTLATSSGPVSITDDRDNLYIADGTTRYAMSVGTGALTVKNDGAFNGATRVDYIDGFMVYNRPNNYMWGCTDLNSPDSSPFNFGIKGASSDNISTLIVVNGEVLLIGTLATEIWVDAGLFPFPFQRLAGTSIQHGCLAAASIARLGESCAWLARDTRGQGVVVQMAGYAPLRISTHAVETDIASFARVDDAVAYTYQQDGHEFYVLNFPEADRTWCYDLATGLWHKRAWRDTNGILHRHRSNCAVLFEGEIIVGDWENGNLYAMDTAVYDDDGDMIQRTRRCPHLTQELRRVFHHDFQIQFQPGVGLQTGQGSDPQAMLKWSDDGGSTWSNEHWRSIGRAGKYMNRCRWAGPLGQSRDRIYEVQVTDPVKAVIISANLNTSAGGN